MVYLNGWNKVRPDQLYNVWAADQIKKVGGLISDEDSSSDKSGEGTELLAKGDTKSDPSSTSRAM